MNSAKPVRWYLVISVLKVTVLLVIVMVSGLVFAQVMSLVIALITVLGDTIADCVLLI